MSSRVKMPPDDLGMCGSCTYANVVHQGNDTTVMCRIIGGYEGTTRIKKRVTQCNRFEHTSAASRHDLYEIAWTVRTDKSGKVIGFTPPEKQS